MRILGSCMPAREYSSSMCVVGPDMNWGRATVHKHLATAHSLACNRALFGSSASSRPRLPTLHRSLGETRATSHKRSKLPYALTVLGRVQAQLRSKAPRIFPQIRRDRFSAREQFSHTLLALVDLALLGFERLAVDVLAPFARLTTKLGGEKAPRSANTIKVDACSRTLRYAYHVDVAEQDDDTKGSREERVVRAGHTKFSITRSLIDCGNSEPLSLSRSHPELRSSSSRQSDNHRRS